MNGHYNVSRRSIIGSLDRYRDMKFKTEDPVGQIMKQMQENSKKRVPSIRSIKSQMRKEGGVLSFSLGEALSPNKQ